MAGMLPGVECARRRRFHQNGGWSESTTTSTRRSSFCLYTSNHDSHLSSTSSSLQRSVIGKAYQEVQDDKLGAAAREAKERLDERLKSGHCKSDHKRNGRKGERRVVVGEVQIEVYVLKSKALKWARKQLGFKLASEEEECAICLDHFKVGETLMHLPCAHRFHSRCLLPWLDNNNAHCPCCRMVILS